MKQQRTRRLMILVVTGVIVTLIWPLVGTGCNGTPVAPDKDEVGRRYAEVWAGSPGDDPPLLTDDEWKDLSAGDSVRTDSNGEAELRLVGCPGSVWVFDNSTLSVWTCTKQAQADSEYWCVEEGTATFNLACAARFDVVDAPSAQVNIQATAFTVTYLPEYQLTLVTVLRGVVKVAPVLNMDTLEIGPAVAVEAGYFLYTMPGEMSPEIGNVPAREPRPLYELPLIVDELGIRGWMDDITGWAETEQLLEPSWPFQGVTIDFGEALADPRVQEAFILAIDKEAVLTSAFPDEEIQLTAIIGNEPVDATTLAYDPEKAQSLLAETGYETGTQLLVVCAQEDEQVLVAASQIAESLSQVNIPTELFPITIGQLAEFVRKLDEYEETFIVVYR
jgi:hypothetical protein